MPGRLRNKINGILYGYIQKRGRVLDTGTVPADVRAAFWILEKTARSPGSKNRFFWNDEVRNLEAAIQENKNHPALTEEGYIGKQEKLKDIAFGEKGNTAQHGCGWVSAFNAWKILGEPKPAFLVAGEVRRGARGHGERGVDPFFLLKYFRSYGFEARLSTGRECMEENARSADAYIMCYLFGQADGSLGGHYIAGFWDADHHCHHVYNGEHGGRETEDRIENVPGKDSLLSMLISIKKTARSGQPC